MNRSSNIFHFVSETGTTQQVALSLLEEHGWNVVQAVKSYQCRQMGLKSGEPESLLGLPLDRTSNQTLNGGETGPGMRKKESEKDPERDDLETNGVNSHQQRMRRGMSNTMNNAQIVNIAHDLVLNGIKESAGGGGGGGGTSLAPGGVIGGGTGGGAVTSAECQKDEVLDTLRCTFILPDINHYPPEFRAFLHKDLIETSTLISLEQAGRLNWWTDIGVCQRLLPLATTGDGNCLLHAASLGIWGFHDRRLTLRKALCHTLNESSAKEAFQRRWRFHQHQINKQSGLIYSEAEWTQEWQNLLKLASPQPRKNAINGESKELDGGGGGGGGLDSDVFYESLEELHVFVLAHVLCRPIIIVADTILKDSNGDALAPISFGGIYLPIECHPNDCYPTPLLLTYDAAHFSAIVPMEHSPSPDDLPPLAAAIPVVDPDFNLLPIHFAIDPGVGCSWGEKDIGGGDLILSETESVDLLRRYLNLESLCVRSGESEEGRKSQLGRAKAGSCSDLVQSPSIECEDLSQVTLSHVPKTSVDRRPGSVRGKRQQTLGGGAGAGGGGSGGGEAGGGGAGEELESGGEKGVPARGLPRSMQNMVRSFGSLGRSFRNRIKNMAKTGKQTTTETKAKSENANGGGKGRKGGPTAVPVDRDRVLCARLKHRRQAFQEDMVRNYLQTALEKFERERKSVEHGCSSSSSGWMEVSCINANCHGLATASTSYLCQSCFERQRQDELGGGGGVTSAPPSKCLQVTPPDNNRMDTGGRMDAGRAAMHDHGGGGIDRVESGPVLPRYVSPQPTLPPNTKFCSPNNRYNSSTVSPKGTTTSTALISSTASGNGPKPNTPGHGDLTLYRDGPPISRDAPLINRDGPPISRDAPPLSRDAPSLSRDAHPINRGAPPINRDAPPINRDAPPINRDAPPLNREGPPNHRNSGLPGGTTKTVEVARDRALVQSPDECVFFRKQIDARNFEKDLEKSLDDLQKTVLISRVSPAAAAAATRMTGSTEVMVDGLKARFHGPSAAAGAGGAGLESREGNSTNGYICSNGRHD